MQIFILLTSALELLVGFVMLLKPSLIPQFSKASPLALMGARMYGAAAITIGVYAALVGLHIEDVALHHPFLIVFLVFHTLVALSVLISRGAGEPADIKVAVLHGVLAAITAYFLF